MAHTWKFVRAGGFDQVQLSSGADLVNLGQLDQKLWVALACPTKGLEFDPRTLELIDADRDGRIRAGELISACAWMGTLLKNADDLLKGEGAVALSAINDAHDEGKRVLAAAKAVLQGLGKADATVLTMADVAEAVKTYDAMKFNGDGVVPPESADDEATRLAATDVIACAGGVDDRSGKQGFTAQTLAAFFKEADAHVAWLEVGEREAAVMPLKAETGAAYAALQVVRAKLDDYFARCRLAAFDARAIAALNREEKEYLALAAKDLTITAAEVAAFPLSRIEANRALPLTTGLNPAWADAVAAFRAKALAPLLGEKTELTEADYALLRAKLEAHEKWVGAKAGASVEKLGAARVRALARPEVRAALEALVAKDKAEEAVQKSVGSVEKLVRYHRDLLELANNFVTFKTFYARKGLAIFQAGTLFLDQRSCELCVRVDDAAKHSSLAPLSRAYLAYCDLSRPATGEKMSIAAAFSAGGSDNLMVGRNGVFYDRQGRDWDATITKLVDNPISVRQAFWSPYKKLLRFVEEQVNKRASAAEADATGKLTGAAAEVDKAADAGAPAAAPATKKVDIGTVAALGVAVGGITAALGGLLGAFFGLGIWMPVGLVGLLLLISGPSMAIAWLKLRQRNLGPLLDANGWAVNAAARVNVPFGASLTKQAALPKGSSHSLTDPYAEEERPWALYLVLLGLLGLGGAYLLGKLDGALPENLRRHHAPTAPVAPTAPAAADPASKAAPTLAPPAPAP